MESEAVQVFIANVAPFLGIRINPDGTVEVVEAAPDFLFTLYQGQETLGTEQANLSDLQGKPVVINFWGGLVPPSRTEMPDLQRFYQAFKDQVVLVGIDIGEFTGLGDRADARNLLEELEITYPAGFTNDGSVIERYKILGIPTTIFIDSDGIIFKTWVGALNYDTLVNITREMLDQG